MNSENSANTPSHEPSHTEQEGALSALNQIAETKQMLAQRSKAPTGYYAVIGFALGLIVFAITQPIPWNFAYLVTALIVEGLVLAWYRSSVGTWSYGDVRARNSWAFWMIAVIVVIVFVVVLFFAKNTIGGLVGGAIVFAAVAIFGPIWDRAYQRQVSQQ